MHLHACVIFAKVHEFFFVRSAGSSEFFSKRVQSPRQSVNLLNIKRGAVTLTDLYLQ